MKCKKELVARDNKRASRVGVMEKKRLGCCGDQITGSGNWVRQRQDFGKRRKGTVKRRVKIREIELGQVEK